MNNPFRVLLVLISCCGSIFAADGVIHSRWANSDPRLDTNPMSSFWRGSEPTYMESDALGKPEPKYRTEIRTRWTKQNLYFFFPQSGQSESDNHDEVTHEYGLCFIGTGGISAQ